MDCPIKNATHGWPHAPVFLYLNMGRNRYMYRQRLAVYSVLIDLLCKKPTVIHVYNCKYIVICYGDNRLQQ